MHINVADAAKPMPDVASKRLFRRRTGPQPVALVGFREWIFSENSGAAGSHTQLAGRPTSNWMRYRSSDCSHHCSTLAVETASILRQFCPQHACYP